MKVNSKEKFLTLTEIYSGHFVVEGNPESIENCIRLACFRRENPDVQCEVLNVNENKSIVFHGSQKSKEEARV